MKNNKQKSSNINDLEEKIINLSLRLKSKTNELNSVSESNKKSIGKLVHNLKNPIGIIYSFSDMIIDNIEGYSPEKLAKHLQIIKESASFSLQMLTEVAKYVQLQSPDLKFTFKSLNYIELVNNVVSEFNAKAAEKSIAIEFDFPESSIFLKVDEAEISLALRNIISNAFRYSKENSTIKITVIDYLNTVETIITDEGIGISEENLPFVLNEYFVVNTYSEDKQKCIGLGLPIATKIIQLHKGKIDVTSTINKGSSIKITLPK